jgi:hypothetical protein
MMTVAEAIDLLEEWVCDFPFASPGARSVFFAAALTLAARPMLGLAPMFLFDATRKDSGKSKLIASLAMMATGEPLRGGKWTGNDEELEKRITAALLAGRNPVVFEEARFINSETLCAALTMDFWGGRILGGSTVLDADMRKLTFFAAGNNQEVGGDMRRRVAGCKLAPSYTEEEGRKRPLRHPNLSQWTQRNRARLLTAWPAPACPARRRLRSSPVRGRGSRTPHEHPRLTPQRPPTLGPRSRPRRNRVPGPGRLPQGVVLLYMEVPGHEELAVSSPSGIPPHDQVPLPVAYQPRSEKDIVNTPAGTRSITTGLGATLTVALNDAVYIAIEEPDGDTAGVALSRRQALWLLAVLGRYTAQLDAQGDDCDIADIQARITQAEIAMSVLAQEEEGY